MGRVSERVELGAAPRELWEFVTDPDNFSRYVSGYVTGRALSDEARGPGARYEWTAALGPLRLQVRERVSEWHDERRVDYEGELAHVPFHSSMELSATDTGTELEVAIEYQPPLGRLGSFADPLLGPWLERDIRQSLERLRRRFPLPGAAEADVEALYRRRAASYNAMTELYRLLGFDLPRYRRLAADALSLRKGSTVVEIGCGTGANFVNLRKRVGESGRVIGIDLTDAMLAQAADRIRREGWRNVELVRSDAARYEFPSGVDGIVSTLALSLSPAYDQVIERGTRALARGGRWVIFDLKLPDRWPSWLVEAALVVARPYGVELELVDRALGSHSSGTCPILGCASYSSEARTWPSVGAMTHSVTRCNARGHKSSVFPRAQAREGPSAQPGRRNPNSDRHDAAGRLPVRHGDVQVVRRSQLSASGAEPRHGFAVSRDRMALSTAREACFSAPPRVPG